MRRGAFALLAAAAACGPPAPPAPAGVELLEGPCGRGLTIVSTDYQSTAVSVTSWDGARAAPVFATSASLGLSGDVVAPTARLPPTESPFAVLVDRYPAAVLSFLDVATAAPLAQLSLATGFAANPQDLLVLDGGRALVTRFGVDAEPGSEPWDGGSDALILDGIPDAPEVVGRVDLGPALDPAEGPYFPRPGRLVRAGDRVFALLAGYSLDFLSGAEGRVVELDPVAPALGAVTRLSGLRGCHGLAASPSGARLAVSCSGSFAGTSAPNPAESGLAVLAVTPSGLVLEASLAAGAAPFGFSLAFASEDVILATTFGTLEDAGTSDELVRWVVGGEASAVWSSAPFSLGELRCEPACGCIGADAELGVLLRLGEEGAVEAAPSPSPLALPPRYLGGL